MLRRDNAGASGLTAVLRPVALFALLSLVPLASLTYLTIHLADRSVVNEVNARVRTTSSVTAVLVQQQMQGVAELTASYADRPSLIEDLRDGNPKHFDNHAINLQLAQLRGARPGIGGVFFTDTHCRLTQVSPSTPEIVGVDFSFRDWCQGVKTTNAPYVSSAYKTAIAGHPLVVATAAIVRASTGPDAGRPLGIIAIVYTLDAIRGFAKEVAQVQGINLTITDQDGTVLVGDTKTQNGSGLGSAAGDPRVRRALAGHSGVTRTKNGGTLSAFAPVPRIGWTVTAGVPTKTALAGIKRLDSTVLRVAGLLGLVLLAGLIMLARTLTMQRKAERDLMDREAHTRAILEAAKDAFISNDADGAIKVWNRQAEDIFGWTEAEAIGRRVSETIIAPRSREAHERRVATFIAGRDHPFVNQRAEITALHRDGHEFPAELTMWAVHSQETWSLNAFARDISDRKRNETDLAGARDQALEASRLKSEFLANMSHEIRTPMNGVLGMTSLLLETELDNDQREFAETVQSSGEALLAILNDILDFSKIEAGRLDLETIDFDLRGLIEEVTSLLSLPAHEKGLELACSLPDDMPPTVQGDPGRLRQVLTNLIGNAVKFTQTGEVLVKMVFGDDRDRFMAHFEVVDTGIGIAEEDRASMFDSFTQADAATTRRYGGTGLGLAICRQLVELMGGELGVDSEPGKGSRFWFSLPLERGRAVLRTVPRASLVGLRMLVVDDNATNRAILTRFLHSWGIASRSVAGADEASRELAASAAVGEPFDAALLDLNMPGVDGIELARRIRMDSTLSPLKLVLLTSSGQGGEAERAREAGIDAYSTKPVRQSQLYNCLAAVIGTQVRTTSKSRTPRQVQPSHGSARGSILVAEDNPVNQRVAIAMLENLGYKVEVVPNGEEAVRAATTASYDAILMDCQMPILDGYEATVEIRRLQQGSGRTPIIAVTASAMRSDQERCEAAGMDDYLSKPLALKSLSATLARWAHATAKPALNHQPLIDGDHDAHSTELRCSTSAERAGSSDSVLDAQVVARLERLGEASGEDLLGQLASLFLADAEARIVSLRQAVAADDATAMRASAHTLSGASANLGATDLALLCANLATDGAAGNLEGSEAKVKAVEVELGRVRSALDLQATS